MALISRITLWLGGIGFLAFGLAFLYAPLATMAAAGVAVEGGTAATELRAFYGGLEIGLGLLLIAADVRPDARRYGLLLCLVSYGSIGLARLFGILIVGSATPFLWAALATEAALAALSAWALFGRRRQSG